MTQHDNLRGIPPVNSIRDLILEREITGSPERATAIAKSIQDGVRADLVRDQSRSVESAIHARIEQLTEVLEQSRFTPAINATGILVHTNLGRAPVSDDTAQAMAAAASSAVALEIEPESGRRGGRMREISRLMHLLTGAESALVVNNNAAAILLTLSALTAGRRVAVSRAEAVEIGGGFRIPDVMRQSGAELVEVGTTNRTYARDFRDALVPDDGAILRVHSSNFAISGFVASPTRSELRDVASDEEVLLIEDLGSGTLVDTAEFGMEHEPTVQESLAAGIDVVMFSGDKLLGGPQAGLIAGRADLLGRIAQAPLARAVRADKVTLAGVATTLRHYLHGNATTAIPVIRMMSWSRATLRQRADTITGALAESSIEVRAVDTTNYVGGGSLPGQALPGVALDVAVPGIPADALSRTLRVMHPTAVFGRIEHDRLLIELRTVLPRDDEVLVEALKRLGE